MQVATLLAAVLGLIGVGLGAFGAHTLKATLEANNSTEIWKTAVLYHLIHAVASLWAAERAPVVVYLWAIGILFFSGSLYTMSLVKLPWLGPITPLGGLFFMAGWVWIAVKAVR
jgi:uncharacterized membrane protein YgdD (TMEM256/DUF423 family)